MISEKRGGDRIAVWSICSSRHFRLSRTAAARHRQHHLYLITGMLVISLFIACLGALANAGYAPANTPRVVDAKSSRAMIPAGLSIPDASVATFSNPPTDDKDLYRAAGGGKKDNLEAFSGKCALTHDFSYPDVAGCLT
ncbi:MAG TPA: hypothetical protein VGY99_20100 [Candidatus Binataceae bacterium]|nr:hypothetical protein [Candidatus Binataceae bacterium]